MFKKTKFFIWATVFLMVGGTMWYLSNQDSTLEPTVAVDDTYISSPTESCDFKVSNEVDLTAKEIAKKNPKIPLKAINTLVYIRKHDEAPTGYEGGRQFFNREKRLPQTTSNSKPIKYREWDVNPLVKGKNRGAERLVTSKKSAYYTADHYKSFTKIEE